MNPQRNALPCLPTLHPLSVESLGLSLGLSVLGAVSAVYIAANRALYFPFHLPSPILITKLWWMNGAAVSGNVDVGIYTVGYTYLLSTGSTAQTAKDLGASVTQTGDTYVRLGAPASASLSADVAAVKTDTAAVKIQTDKMAFTVTNQIDANVLDWKGSAAPAMTGDAYARLGAPAGASVSADVAAVKVDAAATRTQVGTAGAGLTNLGDTRLANLDASVSSRSTYAGADTSGTTTLLTRLSATRAGLLDNLDAAISTRLAAAGYTAPDNTSIAAIKTVTDLFRFHGNAVKSDITEVVDTAVTSINDFKADVSALATSTALAAVSTLVSAVKTVTDKFGFTGSNVNANAQVVADKTGYSLTTAPLTATQTAQAILNAIAASYDASGTIGEAINNAAAGGGGGGGGGSAADVWNYLVASLGGDTTKVGAYLVQLLTAIKAKTDMISTNNFTQIPPVNPQNQSLELYKSDDYTVLSGRVLPGWSSGDWTAYGLLTAASITLYLVSGGIENALGATTALDATTIEATITAAQKVQAKLFTGQNNYTYVVRAVLDSAHGDAVETLVEGKLTVLA